MENIRQAVERARAGKSVLPDQGAAPRGRNLAAARQHDEIEVNPSYLQSRRIVAYNGADPRSRPYDMLRTQVLQSMGAGGWKVLGVTSPTPGCGKTLTAINLALSIARQPDHFVVLVDLDLQKPQIAGSLGLTLPHDGALGVLQEQVELGDVIVPVVAGNQRLVVLPTASTRESSELMGSRAMRSMLQDIKKTFQSYTVILDLPPLLTSDDVIAILPQIDCVLLVAAVGHSAVSEIEECNRHLHASHLIRLVVNKSTEQSSNYYYY